MDSSAAVESPLEVLSRAATMVSRGHPPNGGAESPLSHGCSAAAPTEPQPSSGARSAMDGSRLQQRSSCPSSTTAAAAAQLYLLVPLSVRTPPTAAAAPRRSSEAARRPDEAGAVPLDMRQPAARQDPPPPAARQHPLPPRPSVITCAPPGLRSTPPSSDPPSRPPPPPGLLASSADDPDIDEHFRRSLGSDYQHLFSRGCGKGQLWPMASPPANGCGLSVKFSGNSVDDHFAKALGETWHQLQQQEEGAVGCEDGPWHQPRGRCDERQEDVGGIVDGTRHPV